MHHDVKGIVWEICNRYLREDYAGEYKDEFEQAITELKNGNFASSANILKGLSDKGDPIAQYHLGIIYNNSPNLKDDKKAFEFYEKSAEKEYGPALAMVGVAYAQGEFVAQDPEKAFDYFKRSADQGEIHGLFNLANSYEKGEGTNIDQGKAELYYKKSAELGDGEAAVRVGKLYVLKGDDLAAQEWFEKGVETDPYMSFIIGASYLEGQGGFPFNEQKGNYWLDIAEQKKIAHASMYRNDKAQQANAMAEYHRSRANNSGGCFIATAVYGTYDSYQVVEFRKFRDNVLLKSSYGNSLVRAYYKASPPFANYIRNKNSLKVIVRKLILNPLYNLIRER